MSKITFIEPKSSSLHVFKKFKLPRLGLLVLGTMMKNRGWEVEIIAEEIKNINFKKLKDSEIVGISTITPTANRAYLISDKIRQMNIPVIMGGPHVTFESEEALEHADYIIKGEGEYALMAFIDAWEKDKDFSKVPNISYKKDNIIINNSINDFVKDLDKIPFPDFNLMKSILPEIKRNNIIPIQTSRGCPFDCSFCSVTGMFGKKYRFRSTENIITELKQYNSNKHSIFFYDDNFTANRERAKELLKEMIKNKFKFKWSTQVRVDIVKDMELVKLMKKAGCNILYIGLESINPESLKAMKKSQTKNDIINAINILTKHKFYIHGMFVYGFDEDSWTTVKETIKFAKKSKLTSTQFLILTPLPGSCFYEKMKTEGRIIFNDWSLYDAQHVVFKPKGFNLFELQWAQIISHKKFYSTIENFKRILHGKWLSLVVSYYARNINKLWKKKNKTFLKVLEMIKPKKDVQLNIDYKEIINL